MLTNLYIGYYNQAYVNNFGSYIFVYKSAYVLNKQ
jgi:hypothetical protein